MNVSIRYKGTRYTGVVVTEYDDGERDRHGCGDSWPQVIESEPPIGDCGLPVEDQREIDRLLCAEFVAQRHGEDIDEAYERSRDAELWAGGES